MGNTDPNKTKAGNKYEVKPQYEELSNSYACNMLTINAMKCMWLSKEIGQQGQCINRKIKSSCLNTTVYQPGNHRSVIIGARQPITAHRISSSINSTAVPRNHITATQHIPQHRFSHVHAQAQYRPAATLRNKLKPADATRHAYFTLPMQTPAVNTQNVDQHVLLPQSLSRQKQYRPAATLRNKLKPADATRHAYFTLPMQTPADPNKTKAGNKYEVKPQYEELSQQINMQHAINQCYECMRLSKEIGQLGRCNNRQIISCRLYTTNSKRHGQQQFKPTSLESSTAKRNQKSWKLNLYKVLTTRKQSSNQRKKAHPKAHARKSMHGATYCPKLSSFALLSQLKTASKVGRKRKVFSRGFQLYQELEKRRSESTGNGDRK
ncbi:hypothetical protein F511_07227 [Dorcoceras hygrometricum]|uniref:Uncharacterized protein n=1 Tax=Dorcoceras hygrometricum TaxID=472368 RepID=A0A2Z7B1W5_9LAMI|nr:hypothetical protein F511_07227 [Dorcoceras hygrometricum]